MINPIFVSFFFALAQTASPQKPPAEPTFTDKCSVFLVDVERGQQAAEELLESGGTLTPEFVKNLASTAEKHLGTFEATVAEEELTTKSYPLQLGSLVANVAVYYTDELIRSTGHSDSMTVGILLSDHIEEQVIRSKDSVESHMSYTMDSDIIGVRKRFEFDGRQ